MCAQFQVDTIKFQKALAIFALDLNKSNWKGRIFPHSQAPVIISEKNGYKIKLFNFSLVPVWSKERKPKFATYNVRLETVLEKPTWKRPFLKHHCLVPITSFIESVHYGKLAGHMVRFDLNECVFVPAICDQWKNQETGKLLNSFSILTSTPGKLVKESGHERSPIFIRQNLKVFENWFDISNNTGDSFIELLSKRYEPKMSVKIERKLKPGWEKRV